MMAGEFIWYELITPDPLGAKAFYDAVVGWNIDDHNMMQDGDSDYRMINRGDGGFAGGVLKLDDKMKAGGARPVWLGYIHVDDVDASAEAITTDGGQVHLQPFDIPNVGRVAMVTDPAGVPFYVMKPIPPAGQPDAKSDVFDADKAQHIRWNELSTTDQDGAIAFYGKQFGWTQEGHMPMGEMGDYRFIQANGVGIGAIMPKPAQSPTSAWTTYFGVDDIDRAAGAVKDGGGQLLYDPMEVPGGDYAAAGIDPQGAVFGLVGPRNEGTTA